VFHAAPGKHERPLHAAVDVEPIPDVFPGDGEGLHHGREPPTYLLLVILLVPKPNTRGREHVEAADVRAAGGDCDRELQ
jgi:hypothetical protein